MSKCEICGNELKGIETTNWFDGLCEKCWQEKNYVEYPFKKGISEKNKQIAELKQQLADKKQEYKVLRILFDIVNNPKKDAMLKQTQGLQKKLDIKGQQITKLQNQLKSQPAEIVDKINGEIYTRMVVECKETKYTDINLILHTILKEYQK